jgi:hypothetical protein
MLYVISVSIRSITLSNTISTLWILLGFYIGYFYRPLVQLHAPSGEMWKCTSFSEAHNISSNHTIPAAPKLLPLCRFDLLVNNYNSQHLSKTRTTIMRTPGSCGRRSNLQFPSSKHRTTKLFSRHTISLRTK